MRSMGLSAALFSVAPGQMICLNQRSKLSDHIGQRLGKPSWPTDSCNVAASDNRHLSSIPPGEAPPEGGGGIVVDFDYFCPINFLEQCNTSFGLNSKTFNNYVT